MRKCKFKISQQIFLMINCSADIFLATRWISYSKNKTLGRLYLRTTIVVFTWFWIFEWSTQIEKFDYVEKWYITHLTAYVEQCANCAIILQNMFDNNWYKLSRIFN